jgi:cobalt/nickel transport system permease protein
MGAHFHLIDHYLRVKSPIHNLDGRIKLLFTLASILCVSLLPASSWAAYIFLYSLLLAIMIVSNIDFAYLLKRSALFLPFLMAAFPIIFNENGVVIASFTIGEVAMNISYEGMLQFISLGVKSWLSVTAAVLLASTTNFNELLVAMRSLRLPQLLVSVLGLMWRYLQLMVEEVDRMTRARLSRSGANTTTHTRVGGQLAWRARVTGGMAGILFIRSLERSERIYQAMLARGYDGEIRTLKIPPLSRKEIFILVVVILSMYILSYLFALLSSQS